RRRTLSDDDRATATALLARLGTAPASTVGATPRAIDLDQLVADCLAQPDDDGPRLVLADALLEREDPRGEFMALQLRDARGELAEPERKRMASLLRKHEKAWAGDI